MHPCSCNESQIGSGEHKVQGRFARHQGRRAFRCQFGRAEIPEPGQRQVSGHPIGPPIPIALQRIDSRYARELAEIELQHSFSRQRPATDRQRTPRFVHQGPVVDAADQRPIAWSGKGQGNVRLDSDGNIDRSGARHARRFHLPNRCRRGLRVGEAIRPDIGNLISRAALPLRAKRHGLIVVRGGRINAAELGIRHEPTFHTRQNAAARDEAPGILKEGVGSAPHQGGRSRLQPRAEGVQSGGCRIQRAGQRKECLFGGSLRRRGSRVPILFEISQSRQRCLQVGRLVGIIAQRLNEIAIFTDHILEAPLIQLAGTEHE